MNIDKVVRVVVKMNDDHLTRWSVCEKVRRTTGIRIGWREGDDYRFDAKVVDVETMKNSGLRVEIEE